MDYLLDDCELAVKKVLPVVGLAPNSWSDSNPYFLVCLYHVVVSNCGLVIQYLQFVETLKITFVGIY